MNADILEFDTTLPVILYIRQPWSFTQSEGHILKEMNIKELKRILGPKKEEVAGEYRKLHNEKLQNF
jgi:hypothetical protein